MNIIQLTGSIIQNSTVTDENILNQISVISSILDLFCSGSEGYDDGSNGYFPSNTAKPPNTEILLSSSNVLDQLSQYFTEAESSRLYQMVENLTSFVASLDEFGNDALSEKFSDVLIDIISSIHIWFAINSKEDAQYNDLFNMTNLINIITEASLTNTSAINEHRYWSTCWMDIDLSIVTAENMSQCDGYASNVTWPDNFRTTYLNDSYNDTSKMQCVVSEYIYNEDMVLDIQLGDLNLTYDIIKQPQSNPATIEFLICNIEQIYDSYDENVAYSTARNFSIPFCEYALRHNLDVSVNESIEWSTTGCSVVSHTEECVVCACSSIAVFKVNNYVSEFAPNNPDNPSESSSSFMDIVLTIIVIIGALLIILASVGLIYLRRKEGKNVEEQKDPNREHVDFKVPKTRVELVASASEIDIAKLGIDDHEDSLKDDSDQENDDMYIQLGDYNSWNTRDVVSWLSIINNGSFKKYAPLFLENQVSGEDLGMIQSQHLKEFGIHKFRDREGILQEIRALTDANGTAGYNRVNIHHKNGNETGNVEVAGINVLDTKK